MSDFRPLCGSNQDKDGELRLVDNGSGSVRRAHEDDPLQGLESSAGPKFENVTQLIRACVYSCTQSTSWC